MKRTLVVTIILALGAATTYVIVRYTGLVLLGIGIGAVSVAWAYMWHLEEIKITSWHYRVADNYFHYELKGVCKACPYWLLVVLSTIFFVVEYGAKIIYGTILQLLTLIWQTVGWLFGYEPCWRNLAYRMAHGKKYMFWHYGKESEKDGRKRFYFWPIFLLVPAAVLLITQNFGTHDVFSFYGSTAWYYDVLVSYSAMVIAVAIAEGWRYWAWQPFIWPAIRGSAKWSYRKSCPNVKFVQPAAEPAKPSLPPAQAES